MYTEIILVRHGETEYNREGRMQGGLDSPLTERGRQEAVLLGEALERSDIRIDQWYCSPQGRARQTSQLIREAVSRALPDEELHDDIREIRCGDWEGRRNDEVDPELLKSIRRSVDVRYPNGESLLDVMNRCANFRADWNRALPDRGDVVDQDVHRTFIVAHGNLLRCLGAVLMETGPHFALRALKANTAVSRVFARDHGGYFRLMSWNDTAHLSGGDPFRDLF